MPKTDVKYGRSNIPCEAITDPDKVKKEIDKQYQQFVEHHKCEPLYAICHITWKDDNKGYDVKIQLSPGPNKEQDDEFFFCCNSLNEFKSLTEFGGEDFIVTKFISFEHWHQ